MKKRHGPEFRAAQLDLAKCAACRGKAVVKQLFHELPCLACNASGWVSADTGEALPLDALVTQLSLRLQAADYQIQQLKRPVPVTGPAAQYQQNNGRGAGKTNFTGD